MTRDALRTLPRDGGRFTVVPTDPVREEAAEGPDLRACNGCAEDFARTLDAEAAITGEVRTVSNPILDIDVYLERLKRGAPERAFGVDPRGDTGESFDRGIEYLVKNRLLERSE